MKAKMFLYAVGALAFLAPSEGFSATEEGLFAVRGIGSQKCSRLTETLESDGSDVAQLTLASWVSGWLSNANREAGGTFDVSPILDNQAIGRLVSVICRSNPEAFVESTLAAVTKAMSAGSLAEPSKVIEIVSDGLTVSIRTGALLKVQEKLVSLNYLEEKMADGVYGEASKAALSAFQDENGLSVTGLPDPLTVYSLLVAE